MLMTEEETCHELMDRSVEATIQCLKIDKARALPYKFVLKVISKNSACSESGRVGACSGISGRKETLP